MALDRKQNEPPLVENPYTYAKLAREGQGWLDAMFVAGIAEVLHQTTYIQEYRPNGTYVLRVYRPAVQEQGNPPMEKPLAYEFLPTMDAEFAHWKSWRPTQEEQEMPMEC